MISHVTIDDISVDVEFDYKPGVMGNWEEPPEPATIEITSIKHKGVEIFDIISDCFIDELVSILHQEVQEDPNDNAD